jgi:hypothetical protein
MVVVLYTCLLCIVPYVFGLKKVNEKFAHSLTLVCTLVHKRSIGLGYRIGIAGSLAIDEFRTQKYGTFLSSSNPDIHFYTFVKDFQIQSLAL